MSIEFIVFLVYAGCLGWVLGVQGIYFNTWEYWAWDIALLIVGRIVIRLLFKAVS